MTIPTEPIGSIPRPSALLAAMAGHARGEVSDAALAAAQDEAILDTIRRFEETGSPVITDGEQSKPSFVTYPIAGLTSLGPDGIVIPFADGHQRQLPVLTGGPFRYQVHADSYLKAARGHTKATVKQAVIAPSALSLLYPSAELDGYSREAFLGDLIDEAEADIRGALEAGAHVAQLDFTEGRLSLKLDPSGGVLDSLIAVNNQVLERFSESERARIGVHTCPGGDQDSTHSADIEYAGLLPKLFQLKVGNFYIQLASEADPDKVLAVVAEHLPADARIFIGVTHPIDPRIETGEEGRDRVLAAARHRPADRLGTCDDCGFAPCADDTSTSRDIAFAKIRARVEGTAVAAEQLGV